MTDSTDDTAADDDTLRLASAAPPDLEGADPDLDKQQTELDDLCERWVWWTRSRRFYGPPPRLGSILGQLSGTRARPMRHIDSAIAASAQLAAFHLAYLVQPDALDKIVFHLYYVQRTKPVKTAAAALGISERHFYRLLSDFRLRVHAASLLVLAGNEAARDALPHAPARQV